MARNLTASDRRSLIRLASTLPAGSDERKAILKGLSRLAAKGGASGRAAELLPYDYTSLTIGVKTGDLTPSGMDRYDNQTFRISDSFKATKSSLESAMMRHGNKYPGQPVKLYGNYPGGTDALVLWMPSRGFEVPDYVWEASNLRKTTRSEVARWINGRGPNPALG